MDRRSALALIAAAAVGLAAGGRRAVASDSASDFLDGDGFAYDAFDRLPATRLAVPDGEIRVAVAPGRLALPRSSLLAWIGRAATAVSIYYGRFPVRDLRLVIVPVEGGGVQGGTTWGYRGAAIRMLVGSEADADDLDRDWMMTHEMVHTALPQMARRYDWLSEGLAVYVEPVARVQAGFLTARRIWGDMVRDMPQGLPAPGDRGLDGTPTWGRTYWGGALFCLLADLDILRATHDRLGLRDAMRGVLAAGGNHEADWPIERVLATADRAVGLDVMSRLHARLGDRPESVDLPKLWAALGIEGTGDALRFDDKAPFAAERLAITARPAAG